MPSTNDCYTDWLACRMQRRTSKLSRRCDASFSVITTVYQRTNPELLSELSDTVFAQRPNLLEWIVLAHGPISVSLAQLLEKLSRHARCRIEHHAQNLGPMGGLRYCLERCRGEYVSPVDADDLLTPDALPILAAAIQRHDRPAFVYSDEDHWAEGKPDHPFLRWKFDSVLLTATSYIWHLCAIRRDIALELGLYTDLTAEWCHDWDTAIRIHRAGIEPLHVPEVLYHWRRHADSSTNRPDPESASLRSQRAVLEWIIRESGSPELFEVREFPLFRGLPELYIARIPESPAKVDLVVWGANDLRCATSICDALRTSDHPIGTVYVLGCSLSPGDRARMSSVRVIDTPICTIDRLKELITGASADYMVFCNENVRIESARWLWECDGLMRLHPDVEIIGGRVLDTTRRVLAAAEIFGFNGLIGSADAGRTDSDPGYFATALKPRSCSAPYSELFVVRTAVLLNRIAQVPECATLDSLGVWLGGRTAFSPLLTGIRYELSEAPRVRLKSAEHEAFIRRFGRFMPDLRHYPAAFGWTTETAYKTVPQASGLP